MRQWLCVMGSILLSACAGNAPTLGVVDGQLLPCPSSPNCVASMTSSGDHAVAPLLVAASVTQSRQRLLDYLQTLDAARVVSQQDNYIRVEWTSTLFGFVDDVEFYLQALTANSTQIDMRSAARLGYSDLGVNRRRIETIRAHIQD